jgi:hypothetical protein
MNEFNTLRTRSLGSIPEVNGHIQKLKGLLSDLRKVANSAESALDDGKMRFTPASRMKATKVCQEINHNIDQVAEALSRYQK